MRVHLQKLADLGLNRLLDVDKFSLDSVRSKVHDALSCPYPISKLFICVNGVKNSATRPREY